MRTFARVYINFREESKRNGIIKTAQRFFYYWANNFLQVRSFNIIYLTREHLAPLKAERYKDIESKLANLEDLLSMHREGKWDITETLLEGFRNGDKCLLSYVAGRLAGYTWIHESGTPTLTPSLKLQLPERYLYNFAGFTHPDFRGYGLQPYRHHAILERPEWKDKLGMIGYVECANWSSIKGQTKSGYQKLGTLSLIGTTNHYFTLFSPELKKLGIRRIHAK